MKSLSLAKPFLIVATLLGGGAIAGEGEEPGLAEQMRLLQYYMHKLNLSLEGENQPLAKFYAHEVEEVIEAVEQIESYDGHAIGALTKAMLAPGFERFEKDLDSGDLGKAVSSYDAVINACNSCHLATKHGFIKIRKSADNPYMQSFKAE